VSGADCGGSILVQNSVEILGELTAGIISMDAGTSFGKLLNF
jgi:hypothetical protein